MTVPISPRSVFPICLFTEPAFRLYARIRIWLACQNLGLSRLVRYTAAYMTSRPTRLIMVHRLQVTDRPLRLVPYHRPFGHRPCRPCLCRIQYHSFNHIYLIMQPNPQRFDISL